jgi:hypothetical protein
VAGDEVAAAVTAAPKIHAAAARKATKAEDLEANVAEESEGDADGEPPGTDAEDVDRPRTP